jgi:two-component system response regulator FixJ
MTNKVKQHIFFVDDEPKIRRVVKRTLEGLSVNVSCFAQATDCIKQLRAQTCDLLITDVKMPKMDGMELLTEAKRLTPWLPVLLVTGYGDIPLAVKAVKAGAADFIEKPLDKENLLRKVESIVQKNTRSDSLKGKPLTKTQMKVLKLVIDGKSSKEIAALLQRSVRTVEDHRRHIMCKLGVKNVIELVTVSTQMNLVKLPARRKRKRRKSPRKSSQEAENRG